MAMNCAATKRILDGSWVSCLRRYGARRASSGRRCTTASPPSIPFFVPPNVSTSTPASTVNDRSAADVAAESDGCVGDAGPVDVDRHAVAMGPIADRGHLVGRVHGAELGALRHRHDARLDVVDVADQLATSSS